VGGSELRRMTLAGADDTSLASVAGLLLCVSVDLAQEKIWMSTSSKVFRTDLTGAGITDMGLDVDSINTVRICEPVVVAPPTTTTTGAVVPSACTHLWWSDANSPDKPLFYRIRRRSLTGGPSAAVT